MSTVKIKAQRRQPMSKGALKELRRQGFVPGVVYGRSIESLPVQLPAKEITTTLEKSGESTFLTLELEDGATQLVLPREVQYHMITREMLHVDLLAVARDEEVRTTVPVRVVGTSKSPLQYGLLEIEVRGKPAQIPAGFEVDVTGLVEGDQLYVRDLDIPEGLELFSDLDEAVVGVVEATEFVEPEELEEDELGLLAAMPEEGEAAETDEDTEEEESPTEPPEGA